MIVDLLFILKFNARLRLVRSSSLRFQFSTEAATRSFWLASCAIGVSPWMEDMSWYRIIGVCFIDTIRRGALNGNGGVNSADVTSFSSVNQVEGRQ